MRVVDRRAYGRHDPVGGTLLDGASQIVIVVNAQVLDEQLFLVGGTVVDVVGERGRGGAQLTRRLARTRLVDDVERVRQVALGRYLVRRGRARGRARGRLDAVVGRVDVDDERRGTDENEPRALTN